MDNKLLKLRPFVIEKIWGGHKLAKLKGITSKEKIGETLEVSILENQQCFLEDGTRLSNVFDETQIPYLVKYIETSDNLSVQVHPGDDYARKHENSKGKTECWYILDSQKNSGIFLGLKAGVTKEDFLNAINHGQDVNLLLNFIPVKKGDFIFVPAVRFMR